MPSNQNKNRQNAGFTLVEVMVVILIISILVALGNYGDFTQRREKARMEELAVQLTAMMDQEKTSTLLGKTESGAIVRERKITITTDLTDPMATKLSYTSYADLAEDKEGTYCGIPSRCTELIAAGSPPLTNYALTTKVWQFYDPSLVMTLYQCDTGSAVAANPTNSLTIKLKGDTMTFSSHTEKHIVIFLSRDNAYREIHIDRRTGVVYEQESIINPADPKPSCT